MPKEGRPAVEERPPDGTGSMQHKSRCEIIERRILEHAHGIKTEINHALDNSDCRELT